jgi:phage-related baseplate assembly protein
MPFYQSPSLYIDFSQLPQPDVVETIDYETLLATYKSQVLAANPNLAAALDLEQSPTNIILEAEAYGEMLVRARVNAAARACMLAFATKDDLDNLGALFNVERMSVTTVDSQNQTITTYETDDRFRLRVQMAPEAFTTAGSGGAYTFQALSSDLTIRDARPSVPSPGRVLVSIMNSGSDPTATPSQIANATAQLTDPHIKPLTDDVSVVGVSVIPTNIETTVTLYPGPDATTILNNIAKALTALRSRIALIGRDLTRSSIIAACNQEGVQNVDLISPATDIVADDLSCVWIQSATVTPAILRAE